MKRIGFALLGFMLAGCGLNEPNVPLPPLVPPAPTVVVAPPMTATVVKKFDAAKARELSVVLGPEVTKAQIEAIRGADQRARLALTKLGQQLRHPTMAAMKEAREAVLALEAALR